MKYEELENARREFMEGKRTAASYWSAFRSYWSQFKEEGQMKYEDDIHNCTNERLAEMLEEEAQYNAVTQLSCSYENGTSYRKRQHLFSESAARLIEKHKVYTVCEACGDSYYGYLAPSKIFKDKAKAQAYAKELYDEGFEVTIKEYEVE